MYSIYDHHEMGQEIIATANSSGIAQGFLGPCPEGYQWYVERYTNFSNTAKNSGVLTELFVLTTQQLSSDWTQTVGSRAGRQDVTNVVNQGGDNSSPICVPAGYFLVALWTGLNANDVTEVSTQIAVHQLLPVLSTPQDAAALALQHSAAHEHVRLSHEVVGALEV